MFTQREKIIFSATVLTFAGALGFQFVAVPFLNRNKALDQEIATAKTRLQRYRQLLSRKTGLEAAYKSIFSGGELPLNTEKTGKSILAELDKLAAGSGIYVLDIRPQDQAEDTVIAEAAVDMRAEGDLVGLMKFVNGIEGSATGMRIKRLQINVKPNTGMLEASVTVAQPGSI